MNVDMTKMSMIRLSDEINCLEDENAELSLLINMRGNKDTERLVRKRGPKSARQLELFFCRRVTGGCIMLVFLTSNQSSLILSASCALSQIVLYRRSKVGMPRSLKVFMDSHSFLRATRTF